MFDRNKSILDRFFSKDKTPEKKKFEEPPVKTKAEMDADYESNLAAINKSVETSLLGFEKILADHEKLGDPLVFQLQLKTYKSVIEDRILIIEKKKINKKDEMHVAARDGAIKSLNQLVIQPINDKLAQVAREINENAKMKEIAAQQPVAVTDRVDDINRLDQSRSGVGDRSSSNEHLNSNSNGNVSGEDTSLTSSGASVGKETVDEGTGVEVEKTLDDGKTIETIDEPAAEIAEETITLNISTIESGINQLKLDVENTLKTFTEYKNSLKEKGINPGEVQTIQIHMNKLLNKDKLQERYDNLSNNFSKVDSSGLDDSAQDAIFDNLGNIRINLRILNKISINREIDEIRASRVIPKALPVSTRKIEIDEIDEPFIDQDQGMDKSATTARLGPFIPTPTVTPNKLGEFIPKITHIDQGPVGPFTPAPTVTPNKLGKLGFTPTFSPTEVTWNHSIPTFKYITTENKTKNTVGFTPDYTVFPNAVTWDSFINRKPETDKTSLDQGMDKSTTVSAFESTTGEKTVIDQAQGIMDKPTFPSLDEFLQDSNEATEDDSNEATEDDSNEATFDQEQERKKIAQEIDALLRGSGETPKPSIPPQAIAPMTEEELNAFLQSDDKLVVEEEEVEEDFVVDEEELDEEELDEEELDEEELDEEELDEEELDEEELDEEELDEEESSVVTDEVRAKFVIAPMTEEELNASFQSDDKLVVEEEELVGDSVVEEKELEEEESSDEDVVSKAKVIDIINSIADPEVKAKFDKFDKLIDISNDLLKISNKISDDIKRIPAVPASMNLEQLTNRLNVVHRLQNKMDDLYAAVLNPKCDEFENLEKALIVIVSGSNLDAHHKNILNGFISNLSEEVDNIVDNINSKGHSLNRLETRTQKQITHRKETLKQFKVKVKQSDNDNLEKGQYDQVAYPIFEDIKRFVMEDKFFEKLSNHSKDHPHKAAQIGIYLTSIQTATTLKGLVEAIDADPRIGVTGPSMRKYMPTYNFFMTGKSKSDEYASSLKKDTAAYIQRTYHVDLDSHKVGLDSHKEDLNTKNKMKKSG